jgi:hypothetical protein
MREHLRVGKAIAPAVAVFSDHHSKHLGIEPINHTVLRYAAAPPAPHPQRNPLALLTFHLPPDYVQIVAHPAHRLF